MFFIKLKYLRISYFLNFENPLINNEIRKSFVAHNFLSSFCNGGTGKLWKLFNNPEPLRMTYKHV